MNFTKEELRIIWNSLNTSTAIACRNAEMAMLENGNSDIEWDKFKILAALTSKVTPSEYVDILEESK